jgi:serine phosphatase RsbU (regulator of sigma subunit)
MLGARRAAASLWPGGAGAVVAISEADDAPPADASPELATPLVARDGTEFGMLEVAGKAEGAFTRGDRLALEDLARMGALAIENARLEERERHIARTLQASLLPAELPTIAGLEAAARYLPGGEGTVVGGDLYDLFEVEDGWAFVVGDVCGKGAEAAALTSMVRFTIRAEAAHRAGPGEVLAQVNDAILRQFSDGRFCTALHGRVRVGKEGARVTVACAGHPPPLIVGPEGRAEPLAVGGRLLGVVPAIELEAVETTLAPGEALVCFTDGVTEGRGAGGMFGDGPLATVLASVAGSDADGIAEAVTRAAVDFQGGRTQDDLALLVLRVPGT